MRRFIALSIAILAFAVPLHGQAGVSNTPQALAVPGADWTGTWRGSLVNLPVRQGATPVEVVREVGRIPARDSSCTALRTRYLEGGVERAVKDYQLCRGAGDADFYIDEGDGVRLTARWIGDALVAPFKYNTRLLISTTRVRGDVMEEEILTVDDQPAVNGVRPLVPRGIQRLELRRIASPK
jgi:hypothetical protein